MEETADLCLVVRFKEEVLDPVGRVAIRPCRRDLHKAIHAKLRPTPHDITIPHLPTLTGGTTIDKNPRPHPLDTGVVLRSVN